MDTVRTTIYLPKTVYPVLRDAAHTQQESYGDVITQWYYQTQKLPTSSATADEDLHFFQKVGKSGQKIDLIRALEEDRNR